MHRQTENPKTKPPVASDGRAIDTARYAYKASQKVTKYTFKLVRASLIMAAYVG